MIFILSGPLHSGKTSFTKNLVKKLKSIGLVVRGFLSEAEMIEKQNIGYNLYDLDSGKSIPFIRKKGKPGWQRIGEYYFIPEALEKALQIIRDKKRSDLLLIDEVGPLELSGKGFWPALSEVLKQEKLNFLFVVRSHEVERLCSKLEDKEIKVFDFREPEAFHSILKELKEEKDKEEKIQPPFE